MARARDLIRVIAINDAVYPCWFADLCYACDARWWRLHRGLPGFRGLKIGLDETEFPDVLTMVNSGVAGFDPDPGSLRSGGNSGYQAVHLTAHFGAARDILVGFDFHGSHWFGEHPPEIQNSGPPYSPPSFPDRRDRFAEIKPELAARGLTVVNATPGSELGPGIFPMVDLAAELDALEAKNAK
jgi:hypothetical protein